MGSERRRRSNVVLNLTPLIDIVFLLLVFFMLTAHFIQDQAIDITLPKANSSKPIEKDEYVEIVLTPQGELMLDGKTVAEADLEETLRGALHAPGKRFVRLRGDQESHFGKAVLVMDAARKAGAESLDILTERP
ncbi:MAG: biopolymer transporter ExbD [Gammaproteobacteria bacterium]|jgi:biopolymer transport protein ExbD